MLMKRPYKLLIESQMQFFEKFHQLEKLQVGITDTSYFKPAERTIVLSLQQLDEFYEGMNRNVFAGLFYSILMHEVGHAKYTDVSYDSLLVLANLDMRNIFNILEDNRIERLMTNGKTRFDLLSYVLIDKKNAKLEPHHLGSASTIVLALARMLDSTAPKKYIMETFPEESAKIIALAKEYERTDGLFSKNNDKLWEIIRDVLELAKKIRQKQQEKQEQQKQQENGEKQNQSDEQNDTKTDEEQETNEDDDDESEEDDDDDESEEDGDGEGYSDEMEDFDGEISDLEDELIKIAARGLGHLKQLSKNETIVNPDKYNAKPKYKVDIDDIYKRKGIKGFGDDKSYSSPKLNIRRYVRREKTGYKVFDKNSREIKGKTIKVAVYLDVSGSMMGAKLEIATNYLYSLVTRCPFIDWSLYTFAARTNKITRNELDPWFIKKHLGFATHLEPDEHPKDEKIIIISDGIIDNIPALPKNFLNGDLVYISDDMNRPRGLNLFKRVHTVNISNIIEGINKATQGIREMIRRG
jgi:hypothetical protein